MHPATAAARHASTKRRLPYMSPARPMIGLAAAPTMSVDVATHDTEAMLVSKAEVSAGSSGIETVCSIATTATAKAAANAAGGSRTAGAARAEVAAVVAINPSPAVAGPSPR